MYINKSFTTNHACDHAQFRDAFILNAIQYLESNTVCGAVYWCPYPIRVQDDSNIIFMKRLIFVHITQNIVSSAHFVVAALN